MMLSTSNPAFVSVDAAVNTSRCTTLGTATDSGRASQKYANPPPARRTSGADTTAMMWRERQRLRFSFGGGNGRGALTRCGLGVLTRGSRGFLTRSRRGTLRNVATAGAEAGATTGATTGASRVAVGGTVGADVALVIVVRVAFGGSVAAEINVRVPMAFAVTGESSMRMTACNTSRRSPARW